VVHAGQKVRMVGVRLHPRQEGGLFSTEILLLMGRPTEAIDDVCGLVGVVQFIVTISTFQEACNLRVIKFCVITGRGRTQ